MTVGEVKNLSTALKDREEAAPLSPRMRQAVLLRVDDALAKLDQLALALERAAADVEKQLGAVKSRL